MVQAPKWEFDALPPSGARRGGDPAEYAFTRTLDTFVREALQNANDQSLVRAGARAEVRFDIEELKGEDLTAFREAIGWDTLVRHLQGAAAVRGLGKFRDFADGKGGATSLVLLRVEDRNTSGLVGGEDESDSNFCALCRDSLFSHKQSEGAGGSYGLGKSVYWSFSALSTVVFHSRLATGEHAGRHRLIGRVELPSHAVGEHRFSGPGWFGRPVRVANGVRAESLWDEQALEVAKRLRIDRPPGVTGTTILAVGFRDPTHEGPEDGPQVLERIRASAARFFWPAMHFPRPLRIVVGGQPVVSAGEIGPFAAAWQGRDGKGGRLEKPGDVARRSIPIHLPRRREGKERPEQHAQCELVVRLAGPQDSEVRDNTVAIFRGPGMVVKYLPVDPAGARRFHAFLACGEGRAPESPSDSDRYAEAFFRASEPPGHDEWHVTPRLKDDYVQGGGARLSKLFDDVRKEIRELLSPASVNAQRGPELLQRRYPLGGVGDPSPKSGASAFHFTGLAASFRDGCWHFSGSVEPATTGRAWAATIALKVLGDDGIEIERLKIAEFSLHEGKRGKFERCEDGTVILSAGANIEALRFSGCSEMMSDPHQLCELGLEITGELHEKGGA